MFTYSNIKNSVVSFNQNLASPRNSLSSLMPGWGQNWYVGVVMDMNNVKAQLEGLRDTTAD